MKQNTHHSTQLMPSVGFLSKHWWHYNYTFAHKIICLQWGHHFQTAVDVCQLNACKKFILSQTWPYFCDIFNKFVIELKVVVFGQSILIINQRWNIFRTSWWSLELQKKISLALLIALRKAISNCLPTRGQFHQCSIPTALTPANLCKQA
jgi:hypothetical protein